MPDPCCGRCNYSEVYFPNPAVSENWPRSNLTCYLQQVCSRCQFKYEHGRGKQVIIVQANDPAYMPYTCSKVCKDGCAVLLDRYALAAEVMRFVHYWWQWLLLGIMLGASVISLLLLYRGSAATADEPHKTAGLLAVAVLAMVGGMVMLSAAGVQGTEGEQKVTRTFSGNWQTPVFIVGLFQCTAATLVAVMTCADVAVSMLLCKLSRSLAQCTRRSRSGNTRPIFAISTLRFETLATVAVGTLASTMLVLCTPAKIDNNDSECLVFRNVPESRQWYEQNFVFLRDDSVATDQMVSIWMATAYTVGVFFVVWAVAVAVSVVRKVVVYLRGRRTWCIFLEDKLKARGAEPSHPWKIPTAAAAAAAPHGVVPHTMEASGGAQGGSLLGAHPDEWSAETLRRDGPGVGHGMDGARHGNILHCQGADESTNAGVELDLEKN